MWILFRKYLSINKIKNSAFWWQCTIIYLLIKGIYNVIMKNPALIHQDPFNHLIISFLIISFEALASVSITYTAFWLTLSHLTPHKSWDGRSKSSLIYPHFSTREGGAQGSAASWPRCGGHVMEELGLNIRLPGCAQEHPSPSSPCYSNPTTGLTSWGQFQEAF